jgi:phage-related protein
MVTAQIARIAYSELTILHFASIVFLVAVGITCIAIILYSLKCFISEFLGLFYEVFGHLEWYRAIVHFFCRHIEHVSEEKIKQIEIEAKKLLEEGNSVFVIESISNTFGVKERTLRILLQEILKEYEINNIPLKTDHHINEDYIKPLKTHCERIYYGGVALNKVIRQCRNAGYSQDEIAIAMWRIKPRSEDRELFKEMRKEL